jgi:hypothetical protein
MVCPAVTVDPDAIFTVYVVGDPPFGVMVTVTVKQLSVGVEAVVDTWAS